MSYQRSSGHTVSRLTVHVVWSTKYRYAVLQGDIKVRCRSLLIQICEAEDVRILKGVVSKDHVHMHVEYRPSQSISELVRRLSRSSRKIQQVSNRVFLRRVPTTTSKPKDESLDGPPGSVFSVPNSASSPLKYSSINNSTVSDAPRAAPAVNRTRLSLWSLPALAGRSRASRARPRCQRRCVRR